MISRILDLMSIQMLRVGSLRLPARTSRLPGLVGISLSRPGASRRHIRPGQTPWAASQSRRSMSGASPQRKRSRGQAHCRPRIYRAECRTAGPPRRLAGGLSAAVAARRCAARRPRIVAHPCGLLLRHGSQSEVTARRQPGARSLPPPPHRHCRSRRRGALHIAGAAAHAVYQGRTPWPCPLDHLRPAGEAQHLACGVGSTSAKDQPSAPCAPHLAKSAGRGRIATPAFTAELPPSTLPRGPDVRRLVGGPGGIPPVVPRVVEDARVKQRRRERVRRVGGTRFQQQDRPRGVLAQAGRQHSAGGATPDDDHVRGLGQVRHTNLLTFAGGRVSARHERRAVTLADRRTSKRPPRYPGSSSGACQVPRMDSWVTVPSSAKAAQG
jgi:hypothetical protein